MSDNLKTNSHAGPVNTILLTCAVGILLTGCSAVDNAEPRREEVHIGTTGANVVLDNGLDERVYYFIVGRQVSALINWAPSLDEEHSVAPGRSVSASYEDIMRSESGETQVIVYWWTAVDQEGKRVPGEIEFGIADL